MKRFVCLTLTIALLLTLFVLAPAATNAEGELDIITRRRGEAYEDNAVKAELEAKFGVKLNWKILPSEGYTEATTVTLASGDYPDFMEAGMSNAATEIPLLAQDGVLLPLNDLLTQYGQHILADRSDDKLWLWVDGERYNIPCRYVNVSETFLTIRQDWLDALGLSMPKTLDELKEVARAFTFDDPDKNGAADTYGLGSALNGSWVDTFTVVLGSFGVYKDWMNVDGVYTPWQLTDGALAAAKYFRELYQMGVVDPEFMIETRDQYLENKSLNRYGIEQWYLTQTGAASSWWNTFTTNVPQQKTSVLPVIAADGYTAVWPNVIGQNIATGGFQLLFFANNRDPKTSISLIDYLATDEGADLVTFGKKGMTWDEDANGNYVKLDADAETIKQSGQELYYVVFWHNIYKRNADPLVVSGLDALDGYTVKGNYFPYVYDGDVSALGSLIDTYYIKMLTEKDVDVDATFAQMKTEYLEKGGQAYIDWYNAKMQG